jgi:lipoate-protein ligase B
VTEPEFILRRHRPESPWTYALLDDLQKQVAQRVRQGGAGAILLSEVAPVITVGRRTPEQDVSLLGPIPVLPVKRGGLATYHGPGQWVAFAVDSLDRLVGDRRGVRKMVHALLAAAQDVGARYRTDVRVGQDSELGVWSELGKFAAVGIQVSEGVVQHGLSLNGYRTRDSFLGLRPCGLDKPIDYLLEKQDSEAFEKLGDELLRALRKHLWQGPGESPSGP